MPVKKKKILIVDADSKLPNLAVMKMSAYYKSQGHDVTIQFGNLSYFPAVRRAIAIDGSEFDKVYISVVFTESMKNMILLGDNITIGGSGSGDLKTVLPQYIDAMEPDYSIYPANDWAYGFITRGCKRKCSFCFVPKKEGALHFVKHPSKIVNPKFTKVRFLDNNILAYKNHIGILKWLYKHKIKFEFNQGMDIRLITDKSAELLSKCLYQGVRYTFAFDNIKDKQKIFDGVRIAKRYIKRDWGMCFLIYYHPENPLKDLFYRVNYCLNNKITPYLMRDLACFSHKNASFLTLYYRYTNFHPICEKKTFEEYITGKESRFKKEEQQKILAMYRGERHEW